MTISVLKVTTPGQLKLAHFIRRQVFVEEQGVPQEHEIDDIDGICTHWIMLDSDSQKTIGTIRLVPGDQDNCTLGRMCIHKDQRRMGLARYLVQALETEAKLLGCKSIHVHAQTQTIAFYERLGYILSDGPEFAEEGIMHRSMVKSIK